MIEKIEIMGYWYLPENEGNRIAGILTYIPNDNITLRLFDSFYDAVESIDLMISNPIKNKPVTIYGISSDNEPVTLLDCYIANLEVPSNLVTYKVNRLVIGQHFIDEKALLGNSVRVKFDKLQYWCPPRLWDTEDVTDEDNQSFTQIKYPVNGSEATQLVQVEINDNLTLALRARTHVNFDINSFHVQQNTILDLRYKSDVSLNQILADIHLFNQFLVLATMQDVTTTSICIESEDSSDAIKVFFITPPSSQSVENEFLLDDPRIDDNFQKIIRAWYHTDEAFKPIKDYFIDILRRKDYSIAGFLQVIQAVDGYWQRFKDEEYKRNNPEYAKRNKWHIEKEKEKEKEVSLKTALEKLVDEFKDIPIIKDLQFNYKSIINTRHHYSHLLKDGKKTNVMHEYKEFRSATKSLSALLVCCILEHLGVDKISIGNSLINASSHFLRPDNRDIELTIETNS